MPAVADFALAHDGDEALAQGLRETVRNFRRLVGLMGPLARAREMESTSPARSLTLPTLPEVTLASRDVSAMAVFCSPTE